MRETMPDSGKIFRCTHTKNRQMYPIYGGLRNAANVSKQYVMH